MARVRRTPPSSDMCLSLACMTAAAASASASAAAAAAAAAGDVSPWAGEQRSKSSPCPQRTLHAPPGLFGRFGLLARRRMDDNGLVGPSRILPSPLAPPPPLSPSPAARAVLPHADEIHASSSEPSPEPRLAAASAAASPSGAAPPSARCAGHLAPASRASPGGARSRGGVRACRDCRSRASPSPSRSRSRSPWRELRELRELQSELRSAGERHAPPGWSKGGGIGGFGGG